MNKQAPVHYEGTYCELTIDSPATGIVALRILGRDIGEFGSAPMSQLEKYLSDGRSIELFIDARHTESASVEVSNDWALWLDANRSRFKHVSMLTGSRFIQITAGFVRSFSNLDDVMRIYTDATAFDEALATSVVDANKS